LYNHLRLEYMIRKLNTKAQVPDITILEIIACKSSYFISENSIPNRSELTAKAGDEYVLDIVTKIIQVPKRLSKQHLGKNCELSLLSAYEYSRKSGVYSESHPVFFGTMRFRGQSRSGIAYIPSARKWTIEQQIRSSIFRFIEVREEHFQRGFGGILWIHLSEVNPINLEVEQ